MNKLQAFSGTNPCCPKCRSNQVGRTYCPGGRVFHPHRHGSFREGIEYACPRAEHHDLHCRNCQYGWLEEVAAAKEPLGSAGDKTDESDLPASDAGPKEDS